MAKNKTKLLAHVWETCVKLYGEGEDYIMCSKLTDTRLSYQLIAKVTDSPLQFNLRLKPRL